MSSTRTCLQDDLSTIEQLLIELGDITYPELSERLGFCTKDHIHLVECNVHTKLVIYLSRKITRTGLEVATYNPDELRYGLSDESSIGAREWRAIPWPSGLQFVFHTLYMTSR